VAWAFVTGSFAYVARLVSPLGRHDDLSYQLGYWSAFVLVAVLLCAWGVKIFGAARLRSSLVRVLRAVRWPKAAAWWQIAAVCVGVVLLIRAAPYAYMASGRNSFYTPPISAVEQNAMQAALGPVLRHLTTTGSTLAWQVCGLVAVFWFFIGLGLATVFTPVAILARLSVLGASMTAIVLTVGISSLLRHLSPWVWPF